nr:MAG TPA: antitoxin [Caudoviricetes sp.]
MHYNTNYLSCNKKVKKYLKSYLTSNKLCFNIRCVPSNNSKRKGGILLVNTQELKALLAKNDISQAKMAKMLGITPKTFYTKMSKRVFDSDEIAEMVKILRIPKSECGEIFFN